VKGKGRGRGKIGIDVARSCGWDRVVDRRRERWVEAAELKVHLIRRSTFDDMWVDWDQFAAGAGVGIAIDMAMPPVRSALRRHQRTRLSAVLVDQSTFDSVPWSITNVLPAGSDRRVVIGCRSHTQVLCVHWGKRRVNPFNIDEGRGTIEKLAIRAPAQQRSLQLEELPVMTILPPFECCRIWTQKS